MPETHSVYANLRFHDATGKLIGELEELHCTSSRLLNRLAGKTVVQRPEHGDRPGPAPGTS